VNVTVRQKRDLGTVPEIAKRMAEIERTLEGTGRLLVRYSGTEPKLRIMLEGEREDEIRRYADELAGLVREKLG
jgi:phosphoglucosamine mutase